MTRKPAREEKLDKLFSEVSLVVKKVKEDLDKCQEYLRTLRGDVLKLLDTDRKISERKVAKEALFQKKEERTLTKSAHELVGVLEDLRKLLEEYHEFDEMLAYFDKQDFLGRITEAENKEGDYSRKGGYLEVLKDKVEGHFSKEEYYEKHKDILKQFPDEAENAKRVLKKQADTVSEELDKLDGIHTSLNKLLEDINGFMAMAKQGKLERVPPLTLNIGRCDTVVIDTSFIKKVEEHYKRKNFSGLEVRGKFKKAIIPQMVRYEALKKGGKNLVDSRFYHLFVKMFDAKEKTIGMGDEEKKEVAALWDPVRNKSKLESPAQFKGTADIHILHYARKHHGVTVLAYDSDIPLTIRNDRREFHHNRVICFEDGRLWYAA